MNDEKQKETELGNSLLAVIGGAAAAILTALILSPLIDLVFDRFFHLNLFGFDKGSSADDFILSAAILIWLFIAAFAGGLACSMICRSYEYNHVFVLIGIFCIVSFFAMLESRKEELALGILTTIVVCTGFLSGTKTGISIKKKRKAKKMAD
jgi:hypothetical protein